MDVDTVGMVPMADMLNAQWGSENVRLVLGSSQRTVSDCLHLYFQSKLFFTETHLTMITTEPIGGGEQIVCRTTVLVL